MTTYELRPDGTLRKLPIGSETHRRDAGQDPGMGCGEMPSETIYSHNNDVDVRVSWGNNLSGTVQVASLATGRQTPDQATDRLFSIVNEWLAAAGEPIIDVAKLRAALPYTPMFDGWHAELTDWSEANRLIRVLKRARDQAFGSPE